LYAYEDYLFALKIVFSLLWYVEVEDVIAELSSTSANGEVLRVFRSMVKNSARLEHASQSKKSGTDCPELLVEMASSERVTSGRLKMGIPFPTNSYSIRLHSFHG
jgi:hypothetical protein